MYIMVGPLISRGGSSTVLVLTEQAAGPNPILRLFPSFFFSLPFFPLLFFALSFLFTFMPALPLQCTSIIITVQNKEMYHRA